MSPRPTLAPSAPSAPTSPPGSAGLSASSTHSGRDETRPPDGPRRASVRRPCSTKHCSRGSRSSDRRRTRTTSRRAWTTLGCYSSSCARIRQPGIRCTTTCVPGRPSSPGSSGSVGHVRFQHASFPTAYVPSDSVPGVDRFRAQTGNRTAHAWILTHERPAPWIVCVHGAGMGDPLADIFAFRAGALHRAGFNVAIPVLPHHGPRGAGRFAVGFPTDDPTLNFHGAAQAIADVRAVLVTIEQRNEPAMLLGISLGSYVAAAVAALEPSVRGVVIGVPVVDLSALLRQHAPGRFVRHPLFEALCEVSRSLESYSSALVLPLPTTRIRRIWAGRGDRLVPPDQVERIDIRS